MTEYLKIQLNILNKIFQNSIQKTSVQTHNYVQSELITTPLFNHQLAISNAMIQKTHDFIGGRNKIYSRLAILGDPPNSGKTLSILNYITTLGQINSPPLLSQNSNQYFYNFENQDLSGNYEINVILIPDYLLQQWEDTIKAHTMIPFHIIYNRKSINELKESSNYVLLTNKIYKSFYKYCVNNNIIWKTLIIDQVNNLFLSASLDNFFNITKFTWLVTSDWIPFIFRQCYFSFRDLNNQIEPSIHCRELRSFIADNLNNYFDWQIKSSSYFKNIVPYSNIARTHLLLRCSDDFIKDSIGECLTNINYNIIYKKCRPSVNMSNLHDFFLNTHERVDNIMPTIYKDLNIKFIKESDVEADTIAANYALKKGDDCVICLDSPKNPVVTNCCNHIYCAYCGLKNTILRGLCPLCRTTNTIYNLSMFDNSGQINVVEQYGFKNKKDTCIQYINDYSGDNILIFSQHKNIYYNLYDNNSMAEEIGSLENGSKSRILFLNNPDNITGLKINVKHIIFYSDNIDDILKRKILNLLKLNRVNKNTNQNVNTNVNVNANDINSSKNINLLFLNDCIDISH